MASEDVPPVIDLLEEEEEEWPDAGAQNPEEAQKYVDRTNSIFDHLSELIHEDKKDALEMTIQSFKKWIMKQWAMMGDADVNVVLHTIRDPPQFISTNTSPREDSMFLTLQKAFHLGMSSFASYPRRHDERKKQPS